MVGRLETESVRCIQNTGNEISLTIGGVYRALATTETEQVSGMLRVSDNEGEDYLYPDYWFETMTESNEVDAISDPVTIPAN